jgi:ribosomal protein L11 methyltransferase
MPWISVSLEANAEQVEPFSDALIDAGALAVDVSDAAAGTAQEQPVFGEPRPPMEGGWKRVLLTALFPPDTDVPSLLKLACHAAGMETTVSYRTAPVDDQDWVRVTQAQFAPQRICEGLWIVPSWHVAPEPKAINIVLDPGLAFGTGTHPTTRLCLRWLAAHIRGGESVIDFGCGSGILAIAALKLGAATVCGVDVDERALLAAQNNAMQNQVNAQFFDASDRLGAPAQIVVANILANPLRVLAPLLAGLTEKRGRVVLAGILEDQAVEVGDAYRSWFEMDTAESEDGWVLLSGLKV